MNDSLSQERFSIRPMTLADIDRIMEIEKASFSLPWPENAYRYDLTEQPGARLWVAETHEKDENGTPVYTLAGVIVVWIIVDEAHIGTIAVHPQFRQQGIGEALLIHALKNAAAEGAVISYLEVRKSNTAAQALYKKLGYEVVNIRRRYYKDNNEDALLMTLEDIPAKIN